MIETTSCWKYHWWKLQNFESVIVYNYQIPELSSIKTTKRWKYFLFKLLPNIEGSIDRNYRLLNVSFDGNCRILKIPLSETTKYRKYFLLKIPKIFLIINSKCWKCFRFKLLSNAEGSIDLNYQLLKVSLMEATEYSKWQCLKLPTV